MPTYRVTGPDGASYDVTPPEGTNPSESEILAQVQSQAPQKPAGGIVDTVNAGLKSARDWMQPAANNLVNFVGDVASDFVHPGAAVDKAIRGTGPRSLFSGPSAETRAAPTSTVGRFAAEVANPLPENLTQAGAMAGTMGLSPWGALSRILGGAGGAGIGKAIEGGDAMAVGKAAGLAGVANVVGEGISGALSLGAKSAPGAVTRIRNQDAGRMLDAAPEVSAGLGRVTPQGRTASEAMQDLVRNGKTGLNDAKEEAIQRIESALQNPAVRPGQGGMSEALGPVGPQGGGGGTGPTADTFWQSRRLAEGNAPGSVGAGAPGAPRSLVGERGVPIEIPSMGGRVSLRDANAELTAIGEGLRHAQILDPTMRQREAGRAYAALSNEIRQGLDAEAPGLGAAFQQAQQAYAAGLDYLKKNANPNNWTPGPRGIEYDSRAMQRDLAKNPLAAQRTDQRMGDEGSGVFIDALTRGEGLGRVDKVPAGGGGWADAGMEWLRGSKTGTGGPLLALIRSLVPNLGAQYIGRKPYSMDPGIKALIDLGVLKGVDTGVSPADLAEIRAAQSRRQTAADTPEALQLGITR